LEVVVYQAGKLNEWFHNDNKVNQGEIAVVVSDIAMDELNFSFASKALQTTFEF
jgi:hypothetical protein